MFNLIDNNVTAFFRVHTQLLIESKPNQMDRNSDILINQADKGGIPSGQLSAASHNGFLTRESLNKEILAVSVSNIS